MKKIIASVLALAIAAGFSACGNKASDADTILTDDITVSETENNIAGITEAYGKIDIEDISENTEIPEESTAGTSAVSDNETEEAEDGNEPAYEDDEMPEYIFADELDSELADKLCRMLQAASDNDEEAYLEAFDVDEYIMTVHTKHGYYNDLSAERDKVSEDQIQRYFRRLNEYLNGSFSGTITDIYVEKIEDIYSNAYDISFKAECTGSKVIIWGTVYDNDGKWSAELSPFSIIDDAYYDFEELITEEMLAAARGDKDKYMECVNPELLVEAALSLYFEGEEVSEDELEEIREELWDDVEYLCETSFEDLASVLGENFDGRILEVQSFPYDDFGIFDSAKIYGRILITVKNADGKYQEIEGEAYDLGGSKGVILQPD